VERYAECANFLRSLKIKIQVGFATANALPLRYGRSILERDRAIAMAGTRTA